MGCGCGKNNPPSGLTKDALIAASEERRRQEEVNPNVAKVNQPKTPKTPSLAKKVTNFAKAAVSRGVTNKRADAVAKRLRVLSCHGNPDQLDSPCPYRKESNKRRGVYFCEACGCGDHSQAWLNNPGNPDAYTKLDFPWLSCPMTMPGFSDYVPYGEEEESAKEEYGTNLERKKVIEDIARVLQLDIPEATPNPEEKDNESDENVSDEETT